MLSSIESNVEMTCSVVPVWLSHASKSSRKKLVYALLDSQSNSSFILDQSLDTFNVSLLDVNLSVSTMTGVHQQVSSRKCSGFKVQGYNSSEVIDLPVVYSRPVIPLDRSHIPRQDTFAHFAHLKETSSKLSYFPDIEIGLLIGFNCSQASIPLKVVLGSNSAQPYAVQTPLGWTIIGSTSNSSSYSSVQDCSLNSQSTVISSMLHSRNVPIVSNQDIQQKKSGPSTKCVSLLARVHFDLSSPINTPGRPRFIPAKKPHVRFKIDSQFLGAM